MDAGELTLVTTMVIVVMFLGLLVGILLDPFKRARVFRVFTHKEWGILALVSPDTKNVRFIVVNFGKDVVQSQGKVWIMLKERLYRHDKVERGINLRKEDLPIKYVEGLPTLYVNETTYLPIDLVGDGGEVRPEEVNSVFSSWINNQLAKALSKILSTFKNQQMLLTIACVFSLLAAGVAYMTFQNTNNIQASVDAQGKLISQMCIKDGVCPAPATTTGK